MTKAEKTRISLMLDRVGCIACRRMGIDTPGEQCEVHHIRTGIGMGQRASHMETLPLCYNHHRGAMGYHRSPKHWQERYGDEKYLLDMVNRMIEDGLSS